MHENGLFSRVFAMTQESGPCVMLASLCVTVAGGASWWRLHGPRAKRRCGVLVERTKPLPFEVHPLDRIRQLVAFHDVSHKLDDISDGHHRPDPETSPAHPHS